MHCSDCDSDNDSYSKNSNSLTHSVSNVYDNHTRLSKPSQSLLSEEYEDLNNYINYYKEFSNIPANKDAKSFVKNVDLLKTSNDSYDRPIDKVKLSRTLFESILYPEKAKGFKFPGLFQTLTYTFQQKNSFYVKTNEYGNCLIQVTLGQYLDSSQFKTGTTTTNPLGVAGSQNGTSTVGQSNVFVCSDSSLTGSTPISNTGNIFAASNVNIVPSDIFTMVRAGPMSVQWDYTGRIDAVSGTLTAGINYTSVSSPSGIVAGNDPKGLYPDVTYSTLTALEDCPYARSFHVSESVRAVYVPHDFSALNLRSPTDAVTTIMPQRLYILIIGAIPNSTIGKITITSNWEGMPTKNYSDILTLSYNIFPSDFDHKLIYDYIITQNLIITKDTSEHNVVNFLQIMKHRLNK